MEFKFSATKGRDIKSTTAHTSGGAIQLAEIYFSYGWNVSEIFNIKTGRIIQAQQHHIKEVI